MRCSSSLLAVAVVVAFLASDDARYITESTVVVDAGLLWNDREQ
ncbi:hypothetical protein [Chamaesiphon sp.]